MIVNVLHHVTNPFEQEFLAHSVSEMVLEEEEEHPSTPSKTIPIPYNPVSGSAVTSALSCSVSLMSVDWSSYQLTLYHI